MKRCLLSFLIATPLLTATVSATAQNLPAVQVQPLLAQPGHRNFPSHAQLGVLQVAEIPNAYINGNAIRTAPGFRLFSAENKLIFAHTVLNQDLRVVYVKEASTGWLLTAWILSPEEIARIAAQR